MAKALRNNKKMEESLLVLQKQIGDLYFPTSSSFSNKFI